MTTNNIQKQLLASKFLQINSSIQPKLISISTNSPALPFTDITFLYLTLLASRKPQVFSPKKDRKRRHAGKFKVNVISTLKHLSTIIAFFNIIKTEIIPVKEETDLFISSFEQQTKGLMRLDNCTISERTTQLMLRTNVYIENISLNIDLQTEGLNQNLSGISYFFKTYNFPIEFFTKQL